MDPRLERPTWRGRTNVDALTIAAIEAAEKIAGFVFVITQGSYQSSVEQSAGTHDRGGAIDFSVKGYSQAKRDRMIRALRAVGFAAWVREEWMGDWSDHIHAVLIGHPDLAPSAARQVTEYRAGGDGLVGDRPDYHPRPNPIPVYVWEDDMANSDEILAAIKTLTAKIDRNIELTLLLAEKQKARAAQDKAEHDATQAEIAGG